MLDMMEPPRRHLPLRALPARAYVPGRAPHPHAADAFPAPICLPAEGWAQQVEYLWGVDLYNGGYFWEAHEAWEGLWRVAEPGAAQREFFQALIQCSAAGLKRAMGDREAARRLLARALRRLEALRMRGGDLYMGLDLAAFESALRHAAETKDAPAQSWPPLVLAAP